MNWKAIAGMLLVAGCGPSIVTTASSTSSTTSGSTGPAEGADSISDGIASTSDGMASTVSGPDTGQYEGFDGVCAGLLSDSWIAWQGVRDEADDTYTFSALQYGASRDGPCLPPICNTATSFSVVEGTVVARGLEVTPGSDTEPRECPTAYEEQGDELGTHPDGFPVSTLGDVYQWCCVLAERNGGYREIDDPDLLPGDMTVYVGDDGILSNCGTQSCGFCGCDDGPWVRVVDLVLEE